jgi:hypothetical protein
VYKDKKYVRVAGNLFVEQPDKFGGGVAIIDAQGTTKSNYAGPLSGFCRHLSAHGAFESGNSFAAMSLVRKCESFIEG